MFLAILHQHKKVCSCALGSISKCSKIKRLMVMPATAMPKKEHSLMHTWSIQMNKKK